MEIKITLNGIERTVTKNQIFELAANGTIRPDTNINVDGRQVAAAKIKGIVFEKSSNNSFSAPLSDFPNDFPSFDFPQQEFTNNYAPAQSYPQYSSSRSHRNPNAGNGKAVASFVCGICSLVFCGGLLALPLIGLALGVLGVKSKNQGMAIAGIVMSCIGIFLSFVSFIVIIPAMQVAVQVARCITNEQKIVTAILRFNEKHNALPARYTVDENNKPLHSWRVLILPFLGEKELYDKIRLDEPWDSEHNRQFHSQMPSVYTCQSKRNDKTYQCRYSAIAGKSERGNEGALTPAKEAKLLTGTTNLNSIAKKLNEIVLFIEVNEPFCWMDPLADKTFSDLEAIGTQFGNCHNNKFYVAMGDGSILFLSNQIAPKTLKDMVTRRDIEPTTPIQSSIRPSIRSRIVPSLRSPRPTADPGTITISPKPIPPPPPPPSKNTSSPTTTSSPPTTPGSRIRRIPPSTPKLTSPEKEPSTTTKPEKEPRTTKPKTTTPKKEPATPRRRTRPSKDDDTDDVTQYSAPKILSQISRNLS